MGSVVESIYEAVTNSLDLLSYEIYTLSILFLDKRCTYFPIEITSETIPPVHISDTSWGSFANCFFDALLLFLIYFRFKFNLCDSHSAGSIQYTFSYYTCLPILFQTARPGSRSWAGKGISSTYMDAYSF